MVSTTGYLQAPSLATFLKIVSTAKHTDATDILIALLKRRQIRGSRSVAIAVAKLYVRFISASRVTHLHDIEELISAVKQLGRKLETAQPCEVVIGNIVRRILGVIRDEIENANPSKMDELAWEASRESRLGEIQSDEDDGNTQTPVNERSGADGDNSRPATAHSAVSAHDVSIERLQRQVSKVRISSPHSSISRSSSLMIAPRPTIPSSSHHSMFSLLSLPGTPRDASAASTPPRFASSRPGTQEGSRPAAEEAKLSGDNRDLRPEIIAGIQEILDELSQVDEQIAAHSESYIHANEIILTHGSSTTVKQFLLKAAVKRKFTVVLVESFPNDHVKAHSNIEKPSPPPPPQPPAKGGAAKGKGKVAAPEPSSSSTADLKQTLTKLGVDVILIPDAAVFAFMSRVNKVILGTHAIMANGSLIAAAGTQMIAKCAAEFSTPVVVVAGMYKVSPVYPFNAETLLDIGDASKVVGWDEGEIVEMSDVVNPIMDFVPDGLVDLFITNVGGHPPKYLYKIVEENYHLQDLTL